MAFEKLNDQDLDNVSGGSIVFTPDHTMCGLNCNNQCVVNDYDAMITFIRDNYLSMSEPDMMRQMVALGYMTRVN